MSERLSLRAAVTNRPFYRSELKSVTFIHKILLTGTPDRVYPLTTGCVNCLIKAVIISHEAAPVLENFSRLPLSVGFTLFLQELNPNEIICELFLQLFLKLDPEIRFLQSCLFYSNILRWNTNISPHCHVCFFPSSVKDWPSSDSQAAPSLFRESACCSSGSPRVTSGLAVSGKPRYLSATQFRGVHGNIWEPKNK